MTWHLAEPGRPFASNWHIGAISDHLEAVHRGEIKRLVINIPPGCMKSLTCSVFWPAWEWTIDPGCRFIYASFDQDLVGKRDGSKCLDIILSPFYKTRWGDKVMIRSKDPSAFDFETTARGMRFSTSVGGRLMGRHGNRIVIDDPNKPQGITSLSLAETTRWKKETVASRGLPGMAQVLMMQRLHENDLAGEAEREGGWEFLKLPMFFEPKTRCFTSIGFQDPRTEEGELLWPTFKDPETVAMTVKEMGGPHSATVAAQLQQRPTPASGLIFQKEWFQPYKVLPDSFDFLIDSWDCAFKDLEDSDFVCGQRWGVRGTDYFLFPKRVHARLSFTATLKAVEEFRLHEPLRKPLAVLVEDKANGTAVIDVLSKKIPGFVAIEPEGGKLVRAHAVTPCFEAKSSGHGVWHPDPSIAPWIEEHEAELMKFPKGKNDDSVDATTQALTYLANKASRFHAAMKALQESMANGEGAGWIFGL